MRDRRCDTATVRGEIHAEHTLKKEKKKNTGAHTPHLGEPDGCSSGCSSNCPAMDACELNVAVFIFTK